MSGIPYEKAKSLAKELLKQNNGNAMMSVMRQADLHEKGAGDEIRKQLAKDFRDVKIVHER